MNYRGAITRAKQKRTMEEMRTIGQLWEQRAIELRTYNISGFTYPGVDIPYPQLKAAFIPTYSRTLTQFDGWGRPLQFANGTTDQDTYAIRSAGRDGTFQGTDYAPAVTTDPDCDI